MQVETAELSQWVRETVPERTTGLTLRPLSGDAGARRYYRLTEAPDYLAVYAPPESEDSERFMHLAAHLRGHGLRAPKVYAADLQRGFLLLEHLGDQLFLQALDSDSVDSLYGEALTALLHLQLAAPPELPLEPYCRDKLLGEMELFSQWFVGQLLDYSLDSAEREMLDGVFEWLVDSAREQPACFVHRDFHSRNLIYRETGTPGVIDFQDAVWGPITYDVVSLLRDCYVRWPRGDVARWVKSYAAMARAVELLPDDCDDDQFQYWFDMMGLQRHLKVLGIFARLALRDRKLRYLEDLPLVIRYFLEVIGDYPPLRDFGDWFTRRLLPRIREQSWYRDYRRAGYSPRG